MAREPGPAASLRARLSPFALLAAQVVVVAADFALALTPWASALLTAVEALVGVAWVQVVMLPVRDRPNAAPAPALPSARRADPRAALMRAIVANGVGVLLFVGLIAAKGYILIAFGSSSDVHAGAYRTYTTGILLVFAAGVLGRGGRFARLLRDAAERPARLMATSFGLAGVLGGFLLALPPSLQHTEDASLLDALFMSFGAVCVTGMSTYDVATTLTPFGQGVLLCLIQVGGLGIMALTAALTMLAGGRLQMRSGAVLAEMLDAESRAHLRRTLRSILIWTLVIEALGAGALFAALRAQPALAAAGTGSLVWTAAFHSVSAFCNAGISTLHGGLMPFRGAPSVLGAVAALIVLGGLGFPVLDELRARAWDRLRRRRPPRMSLHARVVLVTSALLTAAVAVGFYVCERTGALRDLPAGEQALVVLFQSVTVRTAGFQTIDFATLGAPALIVTCIAMGIGASPGSTGGGLKTTTVAALFATLRAELRGERAPRLFDRALPAAIGRRALALFVLGVAWISVMVLALLAVSSARPAAVVFEVISASSTAGLTMGLTPTLGSAAKVIVMLGMFVGRIGPLTAALALAKAVAPPPYALPEEKIVVG